MFHVPSVSHQRLLLAVLFLAFWVSIFVPAGAVTSALLALERGKSICAVRGCGKPVAAVVEYQRKEKPIVGSGEIGVGLCADHLQHPPRSMEGDELAWGRWLSLFGLLCVGMYVAEFVKRFRRVGASADTGAARPVYLKRFQPEDTPPAGSSRRDRPVLGFILITAIAVLGLNAGFWFLARYL